MPTVDEPTSARRSIDPDDELVERAVALATRLVVVGHGLETRRQRRRGKRLVRLMDDPSAMDLIVGLTDEVVRIHNADQAASRLRTIVAEHRRSPGIGPVDRTLLRAGALVAPLAPRVVMPLALARLRREFDGVVVPAERRRFEAMTRQLRRQGLDLNVNVLGEAVLGDVAAAARLRANLARIRRADVDYVSVKASSVCAQLSSLAFDRSVERVRDRFRSLLTAAARTVPPAFVNIDMEEHRDLDITIAAFTTVLDEPELIGLDAGIVLQAYLPDSHAALDHLIEWATARRAAGGGTIKVRVVKGANLLMERVDAEIHGWPQAPFSTKAEADSSWKRLVERLLDPDVSDGLRVGAASHNLFDIAFALVRADQLGTGDRLDVEMLSGMADGHARAVRAETGSVPRLYTPVVESSDFEAAIAYLVRRLDEGTEPDHFLPHLFDLDPDSPAFEDERRRFESAVRRRAELDLNPRRNQDRTRGIGQSSPAGAFANESDTDWSVRQNRAWLATHLAAAAVPSEPELVVEPEHVDSAVERAGAAGAGWAGSTTADRRSLLHSVADVMAAQRGRAVACMALDANKAPGQADTEVSEAIDFARWYAHCTHLFDDADADTRPLGIVVVTPPWNFPYAIPAGGVLAALAAGNAVILKPAPESVGTATLLHRQLLEAGVPSDLVQLLRVPDTDVGRRLVTHPDVGAVILTGAAETAAMFLEWSPRRRLLAETSGKNALVVTSAADRDLAVRDLVASAFAHAGQKCSAASLAIIERRALEDHRLLTELVDATRTLHPGPSTDPATDVPPLIRPPSGWLHQALTELGPGESWLLKPRDLGGDLWAPGIKVGVRPGSRSHLDEWFGPVLGIMEADDLDHAIDLQNQTAYGLTGGIHSLDPVEIDRWLERVEVGNAYVNRHITGAIVGRQPFGGWKRSVVGPGAKAGGPGYVSTLCRWVDRPGDRLARATESYRRAWVELGRPMEMSGLRSEANLLRHRSLPGVIVRVQPDADPMDLTLCQLAARTTGTPIELSRASEETEAELVGRLDGSTATRVRVLGSPLAEETVRAAHAGWIDVMDDPPVAEGRVELRRWAREQAISRTMHRYGILTARPSR